MRIKDAVPVGRAFLAFLLAVLCGGGSLWLGRFPVEEKLRSILLLAYWAAVAILFLGADYFWQKRMLAPLQVYLEELAGGKIYAAFPRRLSGPGALLGPVAKGLATRLQQTLSELEEAADQMRTAAGSMEESGAGASAASEQIARTMEEIARQATSLSEIIQNTDKAARAVGEEAGAVAAGARAVEETMTQAGRDVAACRRALEILLETVEKAAGSSRNLAEEIRRHTEGTRQVGDIVESVTEISEQTNMLALNAAIEAARAGDQGRGFAVVAAEIRKLAEQAAVAAKQIKEILEQIHREDMALAQAMEEEAREAEQVVGESREARAALERMDQSLSLVKDKIQDIVALSATQATKAREVNDLMRSASVSAQETAAGTQEAAAASEEQAAAVETMAGATRRLNEMADRLYEGVRQLTLIEIEPEVLTARVREGWQVLRRLAAEEVFVAGEAEEEERFLFAALEKYPIFELLYTARPDGRLRSITNPALAAADFSHRRWFQEARRGKEYTSEVYLSAATYQPCVTLSCPIWNEEGELVGILGGDLLLG